MQTRSGKSTMSNAVKLLLLLNGASWGKGPRVRGKTPKFQKVQVYADQELNGALASPHLLLLQSALRSLRELEQRFNRVISGPEMSAPFATLNIGCHVD